MAVDRLPKRKAEEISNAVHAGLDFINRATEEKMEADAKKQRV